MVDIGGRCARFIGFECEGSEKNGISAALWNIKVFGDSKIDPSQRWIYLPSVAIEEDKINNNMGMLAGDFKLLKGKLQTETINNITGYIIPANDALASSFDYPNTLNADGFTLSMKTYSNNENIFKTLENNGLKISPKTKKIFNSIDNQWHNLVLRSDKNKIELFIDNNKISDLRNSK